jgi:predicted nucleic acid-binding protein
VRYLVDTNLLTQQASAKAKTWLLQHHPQLGISALTFAEIAQGIEALPPSKKRSALEQQLQEMIADFETVPFGLPEALAWGKYVNSQRPVPLMDSLIAATALANNLEVVTANVGDFPGVPVVNPT